MLQTQLNKCAFTSCRKCTKFSPNLLSFNNDFPQVFQTKNYANPQPIDIESMTVPDSPRIGCSFKVVASCLQSSAIEYIVNHSSYITVNNLCKQLYKFYTNSITLQSFSMKPYVIFYDFPGLENGLTKFHDFPQPGETLPNALELASYCKCMD